MHSRLEALAAREQIATRSRPFTLRHDVPTGSAAPPLCPRLTALAAKLWAQGAGTMEIARLVGRPEAAVYNTRARRVPTIFNGQRVRGSGEAR